MHAFAVNRGCFPHSSGAFDIPSAILLRVEQSDVAPTFPNEFPSIEPGFLATLKQFLLRRSYNHRHQ